MSYVSIIIPTYNSQRTIAACLQSLKIQTYPKKMYEIIIIDGHSNDSTVKIAQKFNVKVLFDNQKSPEAAKAKGVMFSRGKYILFLPSDNVLPHTHWLKKMVKILDLNQNLIGIYPAWYTIRSTDSILNRYFALFGANDPVAWFLRKADRLSYLDSIKVIKSLLIKNFTPETLTTIGDNGFLIRKDILTKANVNPKSFFHIDVCMDLVVKGYTQYGQVNESIIHDTGEKLLPFLKKRYHYFSTLYLNQQKQRRYHVYNPKKDTLRLLIFCIYSITLIGPYFHSLKGYLKIRDSAWFIHPSMCFGIVLVYAYAVGKKALSALLPR